MLTTAQMSAPSAIRCRPIEEADLEAVGDLLKKGFGRQRSRRFWTWVLERLAQHPTPAGMPKFGNLLTSDGRVVGAILLISSAVRSGQEASVRCNVSSWYVEPEFRSYGSLLVSNALRNKAVTYLNISPAPHTWGLLKAQGYSCYSRGLFVSVPILGNPPSPSVRIVALDAQSGAAFDPNDRELLVDHMNYGCVSVWCECADGLLPFVFLRRWVRGIVPCFQLIYCRGIADFVRYGSPLGRYLSFRGSPLVIVDADGPIPNLVGRYFDGVRPKFFRGSDPPRVGDLAYTEAAMFGV